MARTKAQSGEKSNVTIRLSDEDKAEIRGILDAQSPLVKLPIAHFLTSAVYEKLERERPKKKSAAGN
jgi:hypothetical protein